MLSRGDGPGPGETLAGKPYSYVFKIQKCSFKKPA
jgi:hypothetical protein